MLTRILLTLAHARPSVGYCQGMNFVVGALLIVGMANMHSSSSGSTCTDKGSSIPKYLDAEIRCDSATDLQDEQLQQESGFIGDWVCDVKEVLCKEEKEARESNLCVYPLDRRMSSAGEISSDIDCSIANSDSITSASIEMKDDSGPLQKKQESEGERAAGETDYLEEKNRQNRVIQNTDRESLLLVEALVFHIMLNIIGDCVSSRSSSSKKNIVSSMQSNPGSEDLQVSGGLNDDEYYSEGEEHLDSSPTFSVKVHNHSPMGSQSAAAVTSFGLSMWGIWHSDLPRMKLRVFQFDRLLKWTFPRLHTHLLVVGLAPEILVSQWMGTLFAYSLPLSLVTEMWGYVFSSFSSPRKGNDLERVAVGEGEGAWPSMFRVAMALLGDREEDILTMDLQELSVLLRRWSVKEEQEKEEENHGSRGRGDESGSIDIDSFDVERDTSEGYGRFGGILKQAQLLSGRINGEVLASLEQDFAMEVLSHSCPPRRCVSPSSSISSFESAINGFVGLGLGVVSGFGTSYNSNKEEGRSGEGGDRDREGVEDGVGWLSRYGNPKAAVSLGRNGTEEGGGEGERMRRIRKELDLRRAQVENDKQAILPKIRKACETLRRCGLERKIAESEYVRLLLIHILIQILFEGLL